MNDFRTHYFEALGIEVLGANAEIKRKDALARAHEIRKFEIELYWKRATYFWAFQLVAFTALGLLFKDGRLQHPQLLVMPASIGVITAFAGYLTSRGSKFWQENWEAHVDFLEDKTEGRLTQVIMCSQPPRFSVSRINQCLLGYLTLGWAVVLSVGAIPKVSEGLESFSRRSVGVWLIGSTALIAVVLACGYMLRSNRTNFTGPAYRLGDTSWTDYSSKRGVTVPFIIWRDSFDASAAPTSGPTESSPTLQHNLLGILLPLLADLQTSSFRADCLDRRPSLTSTGYSALPEIHNFHLPCCRHSCIQSRAMGVEW